MKSWVESQDKASRDRNFLQYTIETDTRLPESVERWIAGLHLLHGIPFTYLVPDEKMLPMEAIRFFYLDLSWIHAMADGALSVGRNTDMDRRIDKLCTMECRDSMKQNLRYPRMSRMNEKHWRKEELKQGFAALDEAKEYTGFFLRSELVRFWKGIEVTGYQKTVDAQGKEKEENKTILRMEVLGDTVLLCIFEGVVDGVDFTEPAEELHFGTREENRLIQVRSIKEGEIGKSVGKTIEVSADSNGRIDVLSLADHLKAALDEENLNAAHLAFQMISAADICRFQRPSS